MRRSVGSGAMNLPTTAASSDARITTAAWSLARALRVSGSKL